MGIIPMETTILIILLVVIIAHMIAINEVAGSVAKGVYLWSKEQDKED
jgi:hypothetical protein